MFLLLLVLDLPEEVQLVVLKNVLMVKRSHRPPMVNAMPQHAVSVVVVAIVHKSPALAAVAVAELVLHRQIAIPRIAPLVWVIGVILV